LRLVITILLLLLCATAHGAEYTFYPTDDGYLKKLDGVLGTACAGVGAAVTGGSNMFVGEALSGFYSVSKSYMWFNISGIPDNETIVTANVNLFIVAEGNTDYVSVDMYSIDDYTPLDATDWTPGSPTLMYSKGHADINVGTYATFPVINYITKNQPLYIQVRTAGQCTAPNPTNDQQVRFRAVEQAGTNQDPYLVIRTTGPAAALGPRVDTQPIINGLVRAVDIP
jgi:hypothetical protein